MQTEAEELSRVLGMAATVASLLERCEDFEQGLPSLGTAASFRRQTDPSAARAVSSIMSATEGVRRVQRGVLKQLIQSTLTVSQHLCEAASLTLAQLSEDKGMEAEPRPAEPSEPRSRIIQLRGEPYRIAERMVEGEERLVVEREASQAPAEVPVQRPTQSVAQPQESPARAASADRRPLASWLRALAGYYSSQTGALRMPVESAPYDAEKAASPSAVVETKLNISGTSSLSHLMAAYRALSNIPGVIDVVPAHIAGGSAALVVRHSNDLILGSAAASALGIAYRMVAASPDSLSFRVEASSR